MGNLLDSQHDGQYGTGSPSEYQNGSVKLIFPANSNCFLTDLFSSSSALFSPVSSMTSLSNATIFRDSSMSPSFFIKPAISFTFSTVLMDARFFPPRECACSHPNVRH